MTAIHIDTVAAANTERWFTWHNLRIPIAALLAIAAAAKFQDFTKILAGDGLLSSQPILLTAIGIEAALAFYLLFGDQLWSWRLTFALFSVFSIISGYAWATGADCNCISQRISGAAMFAVDIAVLAAAWSTRPKHFRSGQRAQPFGNSESVSSAIDAQSRATVAQSSGLVAQIEVTTVHQPSALKHLRSIIPIAIAAAIGIATATGANWRHQTIVASEQPNIEYLIPELMIGKRWPLDSRIDPRLKPLETGRWMVLIVRRDCPHCQEFLDKYFADPTWHRPGERTAVFVAGSNNWHFQVDRVSFDISPSLVFEWSKCEPFVATPAIFEICDQLIMEADSNPLLENPSLLAHYGTYSELE